MQPQDVAELLRATVSDADAVAQYLLSIDAEELNGLLDRFAAHETKKKNEQQRGDWLALVQLLLRSDSTRLRTSTRIIHLVWNGSSNELECMQWLTEISLGYLGAMQEDDNSNNPTAGSNMKNRMRVTAIADEIRMLLRILFELLDDGLQDYGPRSRRVLPQVLGLVPILLGVLADLATTASDAVKSSLELHENLEKLIALPWTPRTIPFLLDLLKESASLMSPSNWLQVQEHLESMLTGREAFPSENMNPILRECIAIGSVTRNCHWVNLARHLFRQLSVRLCQEAEFNLQMVPLSLHSAGLRFKA
uniref:Uncharacterized protein n=1 Tax=Globisporangium ultimum (strain ATCC 200006 / CBS 805.95 / DAOM BR144) TaxID=431595 RepID=K3WV43_GLOUD